MEDYNAIATKLEEVGKDDPFLRGVARMINTHNNEIIRYITTSIEYMEKSGFTDADVIEFGDYCYQQRSYYRG